MSAEDIIILKQYFELSESELSQVSVYATNKAEFDDMKAFLLDTKNVFEAEKITTSKALDKDIMAHLHASPANRQVWYNSVWLFLFPEGKQFYRVPAFQMALTAVIGFGIFGLINTGSLNADTMAFEQNVNTEEVSPVKSKEIIEKIVEESASETEEIVAPAEAELESKLEYYKESTDDLMEESPVTVDNAVMIEEIQFDDVEEEVSLEMAAPEVVKTFTSIEKEKDVSRQLDFEIVELKEQNDEISDVTTVGSSDIELAYKKNEDSKEFKRDKFKKSTATPVATNSETLIMTESEPQPRFLVIDEVEEKVPGSARKAATIENTQELLPLFFEVK